MKWLRFYILPYIIMVVLGRAARVVLPDASRDMYSWWLLIGALGVASLWGTLSLVHYRNTIKKGAFNG